MVVLVPGYALEATADLYRKRGQKQTFFDPLIFSTLLLNGP